MTATLIRALYNVSRGQIGNVVTIGNFDGVHLGHQALVKQVIAKAESLHVPSMVITFEPHPFEFFSQPNITIPRITRLREKFLNLSDCGVDNVLILPFNQKLANLSASDFVTQILYDTLHVKHIIIGDDFHFGYKRLGDIALLKSMALQFDFGVETFNPIIKDNERISSTRVRNALMSGDLATAKSLLGRPYCMIGRVRFGQKLGRNIGFPTANIYLHRKLTPIRGVYTVFMHGVEKKPLPGVANIGVRPTVDGTTSLLEVHLLNFDQDIYGQDVQIEFCKKLRDEIRFDSVELLVKQIHQDVEKAKHYFQKQGVL